MMKAVVYFAGGCFWGVEQFFALVPGVVETQVGYANGRTEAPTYEQVCRENTGHAETVKVVYDPEKVSLPFLLELFFEIIDPTSRNRQGGDVGAQYRTGVYYTDAGDLPVITEALGKLQEKYEAPVVVEALPLTQYYPAEEYHQKYLVKNPEGYCHIPAAFFEKAKEARPEN